MSNIKTKPSEIKEENEELEGLKENLPELLWKDVLAKAEEHKLNNLQTKKLIEKTKTAYQKAMVEPCEGVGIIAAQSLGEPGTQLTLRTKHYAGAAEVSVGSGIQRIEEIVDGRSKTRYASMTVYLTDEFKKNKKNAEDFAKEIIEVKVQDIALIKEDFSKGIAEIELMEEWVEERNLDKEELIEKIREPIKKGKLSKRGDKIAIQFPKDFSLLKMRGEVLKLLKKKLQGITGVEKTIVVEENNEFVIKTLGSNLKAILKKKEVDISRTTTNDVVEISKVLGIEAGRTAIVKELHRVLDENEIDVDLRHLILLADTLTFTGEIRGTVRTGVMRFKSSPFAKAAFEETVKHLFDAALYCETEPLQGVVENIIVGLPVKVGSGRIELVMRE